MSQGLSGEVPTGDTAGRVSRTTQLGKVAARQAARQAVDAVRRPFQSEEEQARARDEQMLKFADDLVAALGTMRGAAMKLGQIISVLNFGLSSQQSRAEFTRRLQPLFSAAPAVGNDALFALIDSELGASGRRMIAHIEDEPIATASIGQVYRATLRDGRQVAIKVQYPSAREAVRADLKNMALLVRLRKPFYPVLGLDAVMDEVRRQIEMELDYRLEWASHRAVYDAHRGHPVFVIPEPIDELCTPRVLVTEFINGTQLHEYSPADAAECDHLGEAIYRFYCGGMYTAGSFCADPHPGNILVLDDQRVAFLDFGLYIQMSRETVETQRALLAAAMNADADATHALARETGFITDAEAMPAQTTLDYMNAVAGWYLQPGVVQITDKTAHKVLAQAMLPRSDFRDSIFKQRMLGTHAFSRRTEMGVCALLGTLHATNNWHSIAAEWAFGSSPCTDMGRAIAEYAAGPSS
jgi:predicted unusual protein kinase regulating ubiquinone biosynthesis (AarF/ABC1/UbiB family)